MTFHIENIIAETAFNHMGRIEFFNELIECSNECGIKKITGQILNPDHFSTVSYSKYAISKQVEISWNYWEEIIIKCQKKSVEFIPCFLDVESFEKLKHLKFDTVKIHSTDLFNYQLTDKLKKYSPSKIILETQACNLHEITLVIDNFKSYGGEIILFHGFSDYPTRIEDQNLGMITYLKDRFKTKMGFADHSLSKDLIPLMAIARGADYIEKHITLKRNENDYDWQVSLEPIEFKETVSNIGQFSPALGADIKYPVSNEIKYKNIIHKKPILTKDLSKGQLITNENIKFVRDNNGIKAGYVGTYLNKSCDVDMVAGEVLEFDKIQRKSIVIAIIARLKSTRLKKKVIKELDNYRLIEILFKRLKKLKNKPKIVLATSYLEEDHLLVEIAKENGIEYLEGDPENVLDRLVTIGENYNADGVVRVTGDNVITDYKLASIMIDEFIKNKHLDYLRVNRLPLGVAPEIFSMKCLYEIYDTIGNPNTSEYLTIYANRPEIFQTGVIHLDDKFYNYCNSFSVDTQDDFNCLYKYYLYLKSLNVSILDSDLIDLSNFLNENPVDAKTILMKRFKLPNKNEMTYKEFIDELQIKEGQSLIINYRGKYEL